MAKEKKFRNGPRISDSGTTHASVSESTIDENDDINSDDDDDAIIPTKDEDKGSGSIVVSASSTNNGDARRAGALRTANGVDVAAMPAAEEPDDDDEDDDDDDDIARRATGWTGEKPAQHCAARSSVATALSTVIVAVLKAYILRSCVRCAKLLFFFCASSVIRLRCDR